MIIAISSENNQGENSQVAHHFGRCPFFTLVNIEDEQLVDYQTITNPYFESHQPGQVPEFISQQGANVMLSGGMGRRAGEFFNQFGIDIATGAEGTVKEAIEAYLRGDLKKGAGCSGHGDGGHHGHEHGEGNCQNH